MASMRVLARASNLGRSNVRSTRGQRKLHQTSSRYAITNLEMPAMSPTMTEGGIAGWKKKEGETFQGGDVLLEIETDKATIDVEAQDDGVMGKILVPDGSKNVLVGKIIALLAEEGDDISNLRVPNEKPAAPKQDASSSTPTPTQLAESTLHAPPSLPPGQSLSSLHPSHSRPIFPSVHRLLIEHSITKPEEIKGTGVRGMLTKGDVLAYLGQASGPTGTYKESAAQVFQPVTLDKKEENEPLDGPALRRLIVSTMLQSSLTARNASPGPVVDFDSIIADYLPSTPLTTQQVTPPPPESGTDYLDGLV